MIQDGNNKEDTREGLEILDERLENNCLNSQQHHSIADVVRECLTVLEGVSELNVHINISGNSDKADIKEKKKISLQRS